MTSWAYVLYALLLIGVLILARNAVLRRERNKFKIQQMEHEAERNEEVNQMKFRFFTNVSHELRTPLTLIISPLESMIKESCWTSARTKWQAYISLFPKEKLCRMCITSAIRS